MSKIDIAFSPDRLVEAKKDFRGVVIDTDFGIDPFGMKGAAGIERRAQLCLKIRTEEYEKDQLEWYAPSDKKLTKSAQASESPFGGSYLSTSLVLAVRNGLI